MKKFRLIYVNRMIGLVGVLLNSFGLKIMLDKTLIHPMYNFTWGRTFCNWLICLFGCVWVQTVDLDQPGSYYQKVYQMYFFVLPLRIAYFASSISDIILILNRYFVITEQRIWILEISKITNLLICYVCSICVHMPRYFAIRLETVGPGDKYDFEFTDFGQSTVFQVWAVGTFVLEAVLGVFILGFFNMLSAVRFHEKMIRKRHLLQNRTEIKSAEVMFTKMVLILTTMCFITRLIDTVAGISFRIIFLRLYDFSDATKNQILLYHDVSCIVILSAHAFEILVYIRIDPNLRRCTRALFCRRTTTETSSVSCKCLRKIFRSLNAINMRLSSKLLLSSIL